ncbi:MAG: hypothetical protein Solumvirus2_51 [Solumvirus sp.]|uniref:Uncharacterized protein n=1 Tax=Solumvirus sp. TaxID=2487773 RepID=A0A3G5AI29_9VIRU|nr:MAG: hypothetical protein Solumvirus2_51 [Solumvirus sp.]
MNQQISYDDFLYISYIDVKDVNQIIWDYYDFLPITKLMLELYMSEMLPEDAQDALNKDFILQNSASSFEYVSQYYTDCCNEEDKDDVNKTKKLLDISTYLDMDGINGIDDMNNKNDYYKFLVDMVEVFEDESGLNKGLCVTLMILFPSIIKIILYNFELEVQKSVMRADGFNEYKYFYLLFNWIAGKDLEWVTNKYHRINSGDRMGDN